MRFNSIAKFLFLLLCVLSCESKRPDVVYQAKKMYGKKIKFPKEYISVAVNEETLLINTKLEKKLKIVTYIDKNSCSECALNILRFWRDLLREVEEYDVGFVPVIYPNDIVALINSLQALEIDFPLLYDKDNMFLKMNKMEKTLAINRSFLLDGNNRIIVIGEPLSSNIWQIYKKILEKRNK